MLTRIASILRVGLLCVVGVAAIACATAPKVHRFPKAKTIKVGYNAAWGAVLDVFADRNIPIATMEKVSGIIVSDWMSTKGANSVRDCGSPGIASVRQDQGKFNVRIRRVGGGVRVTVNSRFVQRRVFDNMVRDVECQSTGKVERLVHSAVANAGPDLPAGSPTSPTTGRPTDLTRGSAIESETTKADGTGGNSCYGNGTCNDGLTCLGGVCLEPNSPPPGADGGACYGNRTCNDGLACSPKTLLCFSKAQDGTEGGACYGNGTCDDGLVCDERSKLCGATVTDPQAPTPKPDKTDAASGPVPAASTGGSGQAIVGATERMTDTRPWLTFTKKLALGLGAITVIGVGAGSYFGIDAISHREDAMDAIANCGTAPSLCNARGTSSYEEARSSADRANIFWGIAITAGVAGGWLWFTDRSSPERESSTASIAPTITSRHLGAILQGAF